MPWHCTYVRASAHSRSPLLAAAIALPTMVARRWLPRSVRWCGVEIVAEGVEDCVPAGLSVDAAATSQGGAAAGPDGPACGGLAGSRLYATRLAPGFDLVFSFSFCVKINRTAQTWMRT